MIQMLDFAFMQRALLAAFLVGITAPTVGIFLVQRQLSLIGDGIGHVALAGVAIGLLTATHPIGMALIVTVIAAILIELVRASGHTSGDTALALMFYGGIAFGVVLMARVTTGGANLDSYLFGAITTTKPADLIIFAILSAIVVSVAVLLRRRLFAIAADPEYSRAVGLPVLPLNILLTVLTAVTVVVSMRVVGLLLISALMIVPNATSQLFARSYARAAAWAVLIGVLCSVGGVSASYYLSTPSGATIVVIAISLFAVISLVTHLTHRITHVRENRRRRKVRHSPTPQ
ncbi:metal ABC transporter permease [Dermatophilus congolensis]|uniref:metal ABC transporter permease n=1 Tax=Dermatophilus congolensis TaxID=1863 RepID=UPI001AAE408E|nr:metal ABC transporter permease [Dermatophilus congolensis]MBO3143691.1 metal ABC transporter permease [Dermatophilus congolensis]MBO3152682.1 metal ABC transporter permease [Dermatophilus congolensis]MBO3160308.1 metal ABC transporter permease [Dermatophilus congolensis]MBO3163966.1 metal ABC transporter permease [Dermatophilus congolensis]MBO3177512.1 metal ABC transporter permease [Dermatophilus congolensis]